MPFFLVRLRTPLLNPLLVGPLATRREAEETLAQLALGPFERPLPPELVAEATAALRAETWIIEAQSRLQARQRAITRHARRTRGTHQPSGSPRAGAGDPSAL
jgi:hypothetical protein